MGAAKPDLYDGYMPGMENGDVMGHEFMGEIVEVGTDSRHALKVGERVVIPFTIICGECEQCRRGNFSVCERSNRNKDVADKMFGPRPRASLDTPISRAATPADRRNMSGFRTPTRRTSRYPRTAFPTSRYFSWATSFPRAGRPRCNATSSPRTRWPFGVADRSDR
jgi:hypothetical protein